jgi:hypothetical protein
LPWQIVERGGCLKLRSGFSHVAFPSQAPPQNRVGETIVSIQLQCLVDLRDRIVVITPPVKKESEVRIQ